MALQEFQNDNWHILTILNFDEIRALIELDTTDYGENTCYDYIEGIGKVNGKFCVDVFIEPVGAMGFEGNDLLKILVFLKDMFLKQPATMTYVKAGWHLYHIADKGTINIDNYTPEEIWTKKPNSER